MNIEIIKRNTKTFSLVILIYSLTFFIFSYQLIFHQNKILFLSLLINFIFLGIILFGLEIPIIFTGLITIISLGMTFKQYSLILSLEVLFLWIGLGIIFYINKKNDKKIFKQNMITSELSKEVAGEIEKKKYLEKETENLTENILWQKQIMDYLKEISRSVDTAQIHNKFLEILKGIFLDSDIKIVPLSSQLTNLEKWVINNKIGIYVEDTDKDTRTADKEKSQVKSIIISPLFSEKEIIGFVEISSAKKYHFSKQNFRLVNILTALKSLSLENAKLYKKTKELAIRDILTQLYTKDYFLEILNQQILFCARYHESFTLVLVDVDNFKKINDTYGHSFGDEVLKKISSFISNIVSEFDHTARFGGEEFALLLKNKDKDEVMKILENLRTGIKRIDFGKDIQISVSIGTSIFPTEATTLSQLIRFADEKLYKAKQLGKDLIITS